MTFQHNASGISALPSMLPRESSDITSMSQSLAPQFPCWDPATAFFPTIPTLTSLMVISRRKLSPCRPFFLREAHSSPSQVMAVQTQFPQAHTQRLQSTSVSAPSAYVSSSRAHSVGPEIRGKSLRARVEQDVLAIVCACYPFPRQDLLVPQRHHI